MACVTLSLTFFVISWICSSVGASWARFCVQSCQMIAVLEGIPVILSGSETEVAGKSAMKQISLTVLERSISGSKNATSLLRCQDAFCQFWYAFSYLREGCVAKCEAQVGHVVVVYVKCFAGGVVDAAGFGYLFAFDHIGGIGQFDPDE